VRSLGITRSGLAVVTATATLTAAGLVLGYPTLTGLGVAGAAAVVVALGFVAFRPRLAVRREVTPLRITVGDNALAELEVLNRGRLPSAGFAAVEHLDGVPLAVPVGTVPGHATRVIRYPIAAPYRGLVAIGPVVLDRRDPLGLLRRSAPLAGETRLWVHPRLHQVRPLPVGMVPDFEGRLDDQAQRGSMAFSSLREYQPGDDPRHIHWPTTARLGTFVVHEHVDTTEPTVSLVLDTRDGVLDADSFEHAVELVASVAAASSRAGQSVSLDALGEDRPAVYSAGGHSLLDRLAAVRRTSARDEAAGLLDLLQVVERATPGGCLVVVSGDEPALVARLTHQRRRFSRVVLVMFTGTDVPQLTRRPGLAVLRAGSAVDAARSWNQLVRGSVAVGA
jgi:uncharacterized protein (DUF58 family)